MHKAVSIWIIVAFIVGCLAIMPEQAESAEIVSDWSYPVGLTFVMDASPDGEYVAIGDTNGYVRLFHESSNVPLWTLGSFGAAIRDVAISANGNCIAFTYADNVQVVNRYGGLISIVNNRDADGGTVAWHLDISEDGSQIFYGLDGIAGNRTEYFDVFGGDNGNWWFAETEKETPETVISGNGAVCVAYGDIEHTLGNQATVLLGREYNYGITAPAIEQDDWYTFTSGTITDVDIDYTGSTIAVVAGTYFGVIDKTNNWVWNINLGMGSSAMDISKDGSVVVSYDRSSNTIYRVENMVQTSVICPNYPTNICTSADGRFTVCAAGNYLYLYDEDLNFITRLDVGDTTDPEEFSLQIGDDGHHIYRKRGQHIYHYEINPTAQMSYAVEYTSGSYNHVNETTEFKIEGNGSAMASQMYYEIDGKGWVMYSGPFNLTGLIEGVHTIAYYAGDSNGYNSATGQVEVWLDSYGLFESIDARLTLLESGIIDIWNTMGTVNATLSTIQARITELNDNLTAIQNTTLNIQENVTALWENNTSLNAIPIMENITALWDNNTINQQSITQVRQDIIGIQTDITNINGNTTILFQDIANEIYRIDSLEANGTLTDGDITTILSDIAALNNDLANVDTEVTGLSASVSALETGHALTAQSITDIEANVTALDTALTGARTSVELLHTDIDTMEATMTDIDDEVGENSEDMLNLNSSLLAAYALGAMGLIFGIIGLLFGVMSLKRKDTHNAESNETKET